MKISTEEFLIYKAAITVGENNFNFNFSRFKLDVPFAIQSNVSLDASKNVLERENSSFIELKPKFPKTSFCKHKYSKSNQSIFVFNCNKSFAIFEKNGDLFSHSIKLPLEKAFINGFAKFTYPEPTTSPNAKGCIFLINNLTLVFCKLNFADYDQLKIKEDYNCFDYRSPLPFLSIIFHDKVIDKFEILEDQKKKYIILSVYKLMQNDVKKYEVLLLDFE